MSPLMLVLLVMFIPPEEPICLFFILDAKSLSATTIDGWVGEGFGRGSCEDEAGQRGEEAGGEDAKGAVTEWKDRGGKMTVEEMRGCGVERREGQSSGTAVHDLQYG